MLLVGDDAAAQEQRLAGGCARKDFPWGQMDTLDSGGLGSA